MKVIVTLDRYDGSQSQLGEIDMDSFSARDMMWRMMEADVAGFTVTKKPPLHKLVKKLENDHA
jgi:hypothetical protein